MDECTSITTEPMLLDGVPATRVIYDLSNRKKVAVYVDDCTYCDGEKKRGETFFPSHFASSRCESGKHNHCTCDTCF